MKLTNDSLLDVVADELAQVLTEPAPALFRYRYWTRGPGSDRYFYTVEPLEFNGRKRYASGIYRYIKSRRVLEPAKVRLHARKGAAIDRAYLLCFGKPRRE